MRILRASFAGHRCIDSFVSVEEKLIKEVTALMNEYDFIEFFVGENGDFDIMATSVVRCLKKTFDHKNASITLVLPYKKANMELYEKQFDSVLIPIASHPKRAITDRNKWMIDNSDLLICYVNKSFGGAAKTLRYAEKGRHVEIKNLSY